MRSVAHTLESDVLKPFADKCFDLLLEPGLGLVDGQVARTLHDDHQPRHDGSVG
jgi:hypothetical protein